MPTADSWDLIELYGFWKEKVLPIAGGLYDQPAAIRQAMGVIANSRARIKSEHDRRRRGL